MPSNIRDRAFVSSAQQEAALLKALEVLADVPHYNAWQVSHFLPYLKGVVLDVGSGTGTLAALFDGPGVEKILVSDHSAEMVRRLKDRFAAHEKYRMFHLDVLSLSTESLGECGPVDRVVSINMLEHVDKDALALRNMADVLKPGGMLLLMVPALPGIQGSLDEIAGHSRRYLKKDLEVMSRQAGLRPVDAYYVNFLGILTWFLAGKVFRVDTFSTLSCRILDKLVPILRFLELGFRPPAGQSVVLIAEKPLSSVNK